MLYLVLNLKGTTLKIKLNGIFSKNLDFELKMLQKEMNF